MKLWLITRTDETTAILVRAADETDARVMAMHRGLRLDDILIAELTPDGKPGLIIKGSRAKARGPLSNNTSGYKGVDWSARRNRYRAKIYANGKRHYLGYFESADDAARAYDAAARELHGDQAWQNLPDGDQA